MSLASDSTRLFVASLLTTLVSLAALSYVARVLGPAEIGVYVLFLAVVSLLAMVADGGIGTAAETRTSEGVEPGVVLSTSAVMSAIAIIVIVAAVFVFREYVTAFVGADVTLAIVLALVVGQANKVVNTTLRGELRVGETAEIGIVRQFVASGVGIGLVLAGYGALGLAYGFILGKLVALVWGSYKIDTRPARPSLAMARSLVGYAKFNLVPTLSGQLTSWTDVVVIAWFLTRADVGAYEMAGKVAAVTLLLAHAVGSSVLPQVAAWRAAERFDQIGRFVSAALIPSLLFVVPAFAGVLAIGPALLEVGFGEAYVDAWPVLAVLAAGKIGTAVRIVVGRALLGMDRPDLLARATVVQTVLNVTLNVVFIWSFGLVGAAVATTFSSAVGTLLVARYLSRQVPITLPVREVVWLFVAAAGMGAVLWVVTNVVPITSEVGLLATIALGAVVFGLFVLASPVLRVVAVDYTRSMRPKRTRVTPEAD